MSTQTNLIATLHGAKDLRLEVRPAVQVGELDAQVDVKATGLCGSDLHYYRHGRNGDFVIREPLAMGHEAAGIVTSVGKGVSHIQPGDRVAIEAGIYCSSCSLCKSGRYNLCPGLRFASSAKTYPHLDGTLQTCFTHPARLLHKMPDNVSFEQASLVEPLSVVLHGSRRSGVRAGHHVAIFGAGAVGLLAASVVKAQGATKVTVIDIDENRLKFALEKSFADNTVLLPLGPRPSSPAESLEISKNTADSILGQSSSDGYDVVFECTGVETCMQAAIYAAKAGGKVVYIGMGTPNATLPVSAAAFREVDLVGVFRYSNTYDDALEMFAANKLASADSLVTHKFKLSDSKNAFETLSNGKDENGRPAIKIMIGDY
ncbi:hypothetical protein E3P92_03187 [Wallemia ichthyophaga]|uniref:Enoyl reductase (ER) domain-containing protein n=2 Tax=Wallemia ichthyophaga TaxID=245174 RepID=A0A4T0J507_WALIC|nr:Sorbitol dehydrogenase [Wallemia ichthyophaga EXF-994]TIA82336.1 hypothetical protein E3P98_01521 [Wallemia ichthyophaga]EOR00568.1 Sorbitol dehydrogenase [Wallemia ichthyophaga EXF-994]TIA88808.1 hypothetical protein E3P97_03360 [Wallemia ichthyophaga]TIA96800.1 hypothetical protein E3P95_03112 [Wallemia ichthyophaga]TIA98107.1 hypothetical protein E3P94_03072 [Wallemia ichthyophaga]